MADFEHKNKVELVGELSKQADVSTTKKGTKVIRFGIKVITGGTLLMWCKAFKDLAERLEKANVTLYPVGTPIRVLGKLVSESWGNGKYVDVVWCNDVQFLQPLEEIIRNIEEEVENELEEVETDDELAPF